MKRYTLIFSWVLSLLIWAACSDLEEKFLDSTSGKENISQDNIEQIVAPAYSNLFRLWIQAEATGSTDEGGLFPIQEISSDEVMIPTRGTDWYDGGKWQQNYLHDWTPDHTHIKELWTELSEGIARANYSLRLLNEFDDSQEVAHYRAELHFLRYYYMYLFTDIYGQVPYRDYSETDFSLDPTIWDRTTAFEKITKALEEEVLPALGDNGNIPYGRPNKDAARMLLAKLYLNQEVYTGESGYSQCLTYLNEVINSGRYALAEDYWSIFGPDNAGNSELIFAAIQSDLADMDNSYKWNVHYQVSFHYNQAWSADIPGGWNGPAVPESYLNGVIAHTDTSKDMRWRDNRFVSENGVYLGYNYGQQFDGEGNPIKDRNGNNLVYTFECPLDGASEANGVRTIKFYPKLVPVNAGRYANDYPIFRLADAYLMRAECNLRLGTNQGAAPVDDINAIRAKRNKAGDGSMQVTAAEVDLDFILNERAIELYNENKRRQDLIRFGKYLEPKDNKPTASDPSRLVCPIPQPQIDMIDALKQNPGY